MEGITKWVNERTPGDHSIWYWRTDHSWSSSRQWVTIRSYDSNTSEPTLEGSWPSTAGTDTSSLRGALLYWRRASSPFKDTCK